MKRNFCLFASILCALSVFAQTPNDGQYIDVSENEVVSIDDIVKDKQAVHKASSSTSHFNKVWRRKTYVDLGINRSSTLTSQNDGEGVRPDGYTLDWGGTFQNGRSFNLHRKPIGQVLRISLDWSWLDIMLNHYNATSTSQYYWDNEKYQLQAGMNIGPSLTLAPFTPIKNANGLHHLKFNVYAHVGYCGGVMYRNGNFNDKMDFNLDNVSFGHGLTTSFGGSVNWRALGIGFEVRNAKHQKYSPDGDMDVPESTSFDTTTKRLFLQFRI